MIQQTGCRLLLLALTAFATAFLLAAPGSSKGTDTAELARLGERLYRTGIGTSGKPVAAIDRSGEKVFAPQFHCVACHRPSGYGSKEGGVYVAPVAAPVLYQPLRPDRARAFSGMYFQQYSDGVAGRLHQARTRPAYDRASLGQLLRSGIDPAGSPIPDAMPRYDLSERDVAALDAWLRTLSARPDPGVDDKRIRFAVIVSPDQPQATRKALLDTTRAYAERINKNTNSDRSRPNFSPYYRSEFASFWREWSVDVWELQGPPSAWPGQLDRYYAQGPVFAVIGAAVSGPWQKVGEFCDREKIPCLFPLTDLPMAEVSEPGYTLYSNGGLPLEAQAMAGYVEREMPQARIVQLASTGPRGTMPAGVLADAYGRGTRASVQTIAVPPGGWDAALAAAMQRGGADSVLALWPDSADEAAAAIAAVKRMNEAPRRIMLGSQAADAAVATLSGDPLAERVRIMRRTELPGVINPHSYRVRGWLNARRVMIDPPQEQFQVYYALSVLEKAVMEIQGDYSREYLIEQIEMIAESNLNPGVFPYLSLGPGQRIASRGCYVVRLAPGAPEGIAADGDMILP